MQQWLGGSAADLGTGEDNTASNAAGAGSGLVLAKTGVDLPFKVIGVESPELSLAVNALDLRISKNTLYTDVKLGAFTLADPVTWESLELTGVGADQLCTVLMLNTNAAARDAGVRVNGGGVANFYSIAGEGSRIQTILPDGDELIEAYAQVTADIEFYVIQSIIV